MNCISGGMKSMRSCNIQLGVGIYKNMANLENGSVILHTATAGKRTFISLFQLDAVSQSNPGIVGIHVQDGAGNTYFDPIYSYLQANSRFERNVTFLKAFELPAGHKIVYHSSAAGLLVSGVISGWEE